MPYLKNVSVFKSVLLDRNGQIYISYKHSQFLDSVIKFVMLNVIMLTSMEFYFKPKTDVYIQRHGPKQLQSFLLALPSSSSFSSSLPFFTRCYISLFIIALQLADECEPVGMCLVSCARLHITCASS